MTLFAVLYVNGRTGVAHRDLTCEHGLEKHLLFGDDVGCFRWLYRPPRPGVQPQLLTDWRECPLCIAEAA